MIPLAEFKSFTRRRDKSVTKSVPLTEFRSFIGGKGKSVTESDSFIRIQIIYDTKRQICHGIWFI